MPENNPSHDYKTELAIVYMEKTCDISKMSIEEYVTKFNEILAEIKQVYSKNKSKWLI